MRQLLFEIPGLGVSVPGFGVMLLLACFGALGLTVWRARREGLDPNSVYDLAIWLFSGGVIGARFFFILMHPEAIQSLGDVFKIWQGGIVFYGCIAGGLTGSLLYWCVRPFPFWPMADAAAPAVALGVSIGRIGCFLNGCCYGGVCRQEWAVRFPVGTLCWYRHLEAGWITPLDDASLPVHPTQLYSFATGLLILAALTIYYPRRRRDGEVMALLMLLYPVARFGVEAFRGDEPAILLGMSAAQVISVVLFAGGLGLCAWLRRQPVGRFAAAGSGGVVFAEAVTPQWVETIDSNSLPERWRREAADGRRITRLTLWRRPASRPLQRSSRAS
jgi:phosphatidylglycerol:prolipoprotein diacylglycerol transferase